MYQGLAYEVQAIMPAVIATGLLVESFTAQMPDGLYTSTNAPSGNYVDVPGLIGIQCTSAVLSSARVTPSEDRATDAVTASAARRVMLDADYTALLAGWLDGWQCVIAYPDGAVTTYYIRGAETDSQTTHSRLEVEEVSV